MVVRFLVNPLVVGAEWFAADAVRYRGRWLCVAWDRTGRRYSRGPGLRVWLDGKLAAAWPDLGPLPVPLG